MIFIIETILLACVIAKYKKLKLLPIFRHWSIYPVIFMALIYIYLESTIWQGNYSLIKYSNVFKTAYLSCFLVLAIHYDQMKRFFQGIGFMLVGGVLNTIAIMANSEKMPVFICNSWATGIAKPDMFVTALQYGDIHVMGNMYSRFIPICDIFDLGFNIYSIGDFLIFSFVFLIIYYSVKESNKRFSIMSK